MINFVGTLTTVFQGGTELQECVLITGWAPVKENNTDTHASVIVAVQITELECFGEGPL